MNKRLLILGTLGEFEQLVLSVMKKELQAVVNLGALIGFVIGLINLIVL